jgi:hypothetical protein
VSQIAVFCFDNYIEVLRNVQQIEVQQLTLRNAGTAVDDSAATREVHLDAGIEIREKKGSKQGFFGQAFWQDLHAGQVPCMVTWAKG